MYVLSIPTKHLDKLKFLSTIFFLPVAAVVSMSCRAWIQSPRASDEHEMRSISKCLCRTGKKKAESWVKTWQPSNRFFLVFGLNQLLKSYVLCHTKPTGFSESTSVASG